MVLDVIESLLEAEQWRVYRSGDVPGTPVYPYLLLYSLQPVPVRSMARPEGARRFRFGVTCVDSGGQYIDADADKVETLLEGSRALHPSSRIEMDARHPATRDADLTEDGQEPHTLPIHFTATIPRGAIA